MQTVGVFVQPKADMGNPDHVRGLVGLVEQMLFTTDPRPYENVAGCDWLDAKDPDWLDPKHLPPIFHSCTRQKTASSCEHM